MNLHFNMNFIKLSEAKIFQLKKFEEKQYKAWDTILKKWNVSEVPAKGLSPRWKFVVSVKGPNNKEERLMEISQDQLGQCLVGAFDLHKNLYDVIFECKTNGKTGLEIRYWINPLRMPISQPYEIDKPLRTEEEPPIGF